MQIMHIRIFPSQWDMAGNLQMTRPLIMNGLVAAFSPQQLIDIMCASDTGLESQSQNDDDDEQSTEVDNMIDVVYEDETDDEANF